MPHLITHFDETCGRGQKEMRKDAMEMLEDGIRASDPGVGTRRQVHLEGDTLHVGTLRFDLDTIERIYLVGAGKGAYPIAAVLEETLGSRISEGVVVVKRGEKKGSILRII